MESPISPDAGQQNQQNNQQEGVGLSRRGVDYGPILRALGISESEWIRIIREIDSNQNVALALSFEEMARIIYRPEEAKKVVEGWLSSIEKNERYYSHEKVNEFIYRKLQTALAWLNSIKYPVTGTPEQQEELSRQIELAKQEIIEEAHARTGVHDLRRAIALNDFKALEHYTTEVGMRGLLLSFKTKQATIAFNTYQRFFERFLYNYAKAKNKKTGEETIGIYKVRVTPELITKFIRPAVEEELTRNWRLYGFNSEDEVRDAERIGYSAFTASQRRAVHTSRGHINNEFSIEEAFDEAGNSLTPREILKNPDFLSDPDEILSNLYSPLELQLIKWSRPSQAQWEVLNEVMTFMGDGSLQNGEQIFNNSLNIADLFSSGWRITKALETIEIRIKAATNYNSLAPEEQRRVDYRIKSLGLGMRMKIAGTGTKAEERETQRRQLDAIAKYRPLELLKEFVVDIDRHGNKKNKTPRQEQIKQMFDSGEFRVGERVFHNYIELEEALGRYAYPIYEAGLRGLVDGEVGRTRDWATMRGIDIGTAGAAPNPSNPFAQEDYAIIRKVVDDINSKLRAADPNRRDLLEVDQFIELYQRVQNVVQDQETIDDMIKGMGSSHSYFFSRTMFVDDVPFDLLEEEYILPDGTKDIALSNKYNEGQGGGRDSYRRIWNDTNSAYNASLNFMKAIFSTNIDGLYESLVEGAQNTNMYAGKEPAMRLVYSIAGGWLKLARADSLYGALGLQNKLPIATSDFEKWFGQGAPSMSREELFQAAEKLKLIFGDLSKESDSIKEIEKRMSKELGTGKLTMWLTRSKTLLLVIILALVQQALKDLEEDTKE